MTLNDGGDGDGEGGLDRHLILPVRLLGETAVLPFHRTPDSLILTAEFKLSPWQIVFI